MIGHLVVRLVTPAMIGGAAARKCDDPPTLRSPTLRGSLRFWSRALGGRDLETELWGEEQLGQRVRFLAPRARTRTGTLSAPRDALLIPSRGYEAPMVPPGDVVTLRLAIPAAIDRDRLRAVLWTWLHLGSVGRRSNRGYGSLQWLPAEGDLLAGWPPLWPSHHLRSPTTLAAYLDSGFERVEQVLGRPVRSPRSDCRNSELVTLDQVFVGEALEGAWQAATGARAAGPDSLESIVHGLRETARGSREIDRRQMGSAEKPRRPSPMRWRLFPRADERAFIPVMTWFPDGYEASVYPQVDPGGGLYAYLNGRLKFERSLTGGELAGDGSLPTSGAM